MTMSNTTQRDAAVQPGSRIAVFFFYLVRKEIFTKIKGLAVFT